MPFFDFNRIDYKQLRDKVLIKSITGDRSQLCLIKLRKGEQTFHQHDQEQIGIIVRGRVEVTIGDSIQVLGDNCGYYIPSNVAHGFRVLSDDGIEYIEVFCPPKKENA